MTDVLVLVRRSALEGTTWCVQPTCTNLFQELILKGVPVITVHVGALEKGAVRRAVGTLFRVAAA